MADPSVGEEDKLKDLISDRLQTLGIVSECKENLRQAVFQILQDHPIEPEKSDLIKYNKNNQLLEQYLNSEEGVISLYLIKNTLDALGLYQTQLTFEKEIGGLSNLYRCKSENDIEKLLERLRNQLQNNHNNDNLSKLEKNFKSDNQSSSSLSSPSASVGLESLKILKQNNGDLVCKNFVDDKPIMFQIFHDLLNREQSPSSAANTINSSSPVTSCNNETFTKSYSKVTDSPDGAN